MHPQALCLCALALSFGCPFLQPLCLKRDGLELFLNLEKPMKLIGVLNPELNHVLSQYSVLLTQAPALSEGRGTLDLVGLPEPGGFWVRGCPNLALGGAGLHWIAAGGTGRTCEDGAVGTGTPG